MKTIEHGNKYFETKRLKCRKCNCDFEITFDDVYFMEDRNNKNKLVAYCPECRHCININKEDK